MYENEGSGMQCVLSFLSRVRIPVLASNDFDLWSGHYFIAFHLKGRVLDDECPNVVAQTVSVKVTFQRSLRLH